MKYFSLALAALNVVIVLLNLSSIVMGQWTGVEFIVVPLNAFCAYLMYDLYRDQRDRDAALAVRLKSEDWG